MKLFHNREFYRKKDGTIPSANENGPKGFQLQIIIPVFTNKPGTTAFFDA